MARFPAVARQFANIDVELSLVEGLGGLGERQSCRDTRHVSNQLWTKQQSDISVLFQTATSTCRAGLVPVSVQAGEREREREILERF